MDIETRPSGKRNTRARRVWAFVFLSLILHLPFTPFLGYLGLFSLLKAPEEIPDLGEIRGIPIELLSSDPGASEAVPAEEPAAAPVEAPAPAAEASNAADARAPLGDAGADASAEDAAVPDAGVDAGPDAGVDAGPDAGVEVADASPLDAGDAAPATDADAGDAEAVSSLDAGDSGGDPVALSGAAGAVADSNANVSAVIYTEAIRRHSLGPRVGRILSSLYQWRDFFGPTGLDPIRDIDRILIAGPQFRDTSDVVVVLQHHLPPAELRRAIARLVKRDPEGAWLPAQVPVARASADRASRFFVLPNDHLVIIAPKSALADALSNKGKASLRPAAGRELMVARLVLPWRAFVGMPFRIPHSMKWAKVILETRVGGRVAINLEAEDDSEAGAEETAALLERTVASVSSLNWGVLGALLGGSQHRFLETWHFEAQGPKVVGTIVLTDAQVSGILDLLEAALAQMEHRSLPKPVEPAPPKPGSSVPKTRTVPKPTPAAPP